MGYRFRLHVRIPWSAAVSKTSRSNAGSGKHSRIAKATQNIVTAAADAGAHSRAPRAVSVDILLPKHKTAIFIHGCFWHRHAGCKNCTTPTNRREWWLAKLNGNAARKVAVRKHLHQAALRKLGWRVIVIWECEAECDDCVGILRRQLRPPARRIPTGFRHSAQRCEERATLG